MRKTDGESNKDMRDKETVLKVEEEKEHTAVESIRLKPRLGVLGRDTFEDKEEILQ